ncbi:MAG: VWA domain-containing protein [Desulfobacterales bacterium]|nr:VWA domain-containing protein [Desulfobacterales bacterium]
MHFESPWSFLLLLFIPFLVWFNKKKGRGGAIRFSSTSNAAKAGRSLRQQMSFLPLAMRLLAVICLIIALARPQTGREEIREISQGVALEMVLDRSGSMGAEMEYKRSRMNRLEVVKQVFKEFALGDGRDLPGRPNDLIGMISFARYPDTICPLTLAHGALLPFLESVKLVKTREEDGTAIGDALALAAARLKNAHEALEKQRQDSTKTYKIKSKAIILLSDGENNAGKRDPLQAAELAEKWGIKVYTIAIGGGEAVTSQGSLFGMFKVLQGPGVDTDTLEKIAEKTGGFFRKAEDAETLREIYEEIDKMEKSEIESVRFVDYKEAFLVFAILSLVFLSIEIILNATLFRKIP